EVAVEEVLPGAGELPVDRAPPSQIVPEAAETVGAIGVELRLEKTPRGEQLELALFGLEPLPLELGPSRNGLGGRGLVVEDHLGHDRFVAGANQFGLGDLQPDQKPQAALTDLQPPLPPEGPSRRSAEGPCAVKRFPGKRVLHFLLEPEVLFFGERLAVDRDTSRFFGQRLNFLPRLEALVAGLDLGVELAIG